MSKIFKKIWSFIKKLFGGKSEGSGSVPSDFKVEAAYGGANFNKAVEDKNAVIGNLVVTDGAMRYSWVKGNLQGWGLADSDANALAIFAVKDSSGVWKGGKFEWISKSRVTRSFGNIKVGYGGWPKNAIETAKGYAFCICSKDCKKRTNWITCDKRSVDIKIRAFRTPMEKMDPEQPTTKKRGRPRKNVTK